MAAGYAPTTDNPMDEEWLARYEEEIKHPPCNADQLRNFASARAGKLNFQSARKLMDKVVEQAQRRKEEEEIERGEGQGAWGYKVWTTEKIAYRVVATQGDVHRHRRVLALLGAT